MCLCDIYSRPACRQCTLAHSSTLLHRTIHNTTLGVCSSSTTAGNVELTDMLSCANSVTRCLIIQFLASCTGGSCFGWPCHVFAHNYVRESTSAATYMWMWNHLKSLLVAARLSETQVCMVLVALHPGGMYYLLCGAGRV